MKVEIFMIRVTVICLPFILQSTSIIIKVHNSLLEFEKEFNDNTSFGFCKTPNQFINKITIQFKISIEF